LAANFAGNNQTMGVRRTADFLEKLTWSLAIAILVFSFAATMFMHSGSGDAIEDSAIKEQLQNVAEPSSIPFANEDE
jgi:preprotein translocase subunit SecG